MTFATTFRPLAVLCAAGLTVTACGGGSSKPGATTSSAAGSASTTSSTSAAAPSTTTATSASSSASTSASATTSAAASSKPFSVTLPAGYRSDPSKAAGVVIAVYIGPVVEKFAANVNITQEPARGYSVQTAQRSVVAGLKKALKITKLSRVSSLKIDGEPALSYSFEDAQNGFNLKQGQVVVIHKDYVYVITFTAPVTQFSKQSPKAVQLIKSLRFN